MSVISKRIENQDRKELINLEASVILRKKDNKFKVAYGLKTAFGDIQEGKFHMLRRPQISSLFSHIFRNN